MEYYKAYDKRYGQVHSNNMLWASRDNTNEVIEFLDKYKCSKDDYVLDQTTPNMIQGLKGIFARKPLISREI